MEGECIRNDSAPIQLAQCRFPGLAISNAKISIYFSNKIYGSNFIKQHVETVMVWNYQHAHCSLRRNFIASFIIIFGTLSFPVNMTSHTGQSSTIITAMYFRTHTFLNLHNNDDLCKMLLHIKRKQQLGNVSRCFLFTDPVFSEQLVDKLQHVHIYNTCCNCE